MLFKEVLLVFHEKFTEIRRKTSSLSEEANQMIVLCTKTLNSLKHLVSTKGFENRAAEIRFFKEVKVIPMQYLIYYTEVRSCELRFPKIGVEEQRNFLEKQVDKVNRFFGKHTEFLIYLDQGYEHFDKHYFTRKHLNDAPMVKSYPYYKDFAFNTSHDEVLARIRAFDLFANYLKSKKQEMEKVATPVAPEKKKSKIYWTGSYSALVEMLYGCDAMSYFNDGNMNIGKIIEEIGDFLNVERGNSSRTFNELKNRKHSRIKFFEETGQKLLEKMDKEDGQHSNL